MKPKNEEKYRQYTGQTVNGRRLKTVLPSTVYRKTSIFSVLLGLRFNINAKSYKRKIEMNKQYNTVIWDWNGTLLNDVEMCVDIANQLLISHGRIPQNLTDYKSIFGFPVKDYYEQVGFDFSKESFPSLAEKFMATYSSDVLNCQLHTNAIHVLETFKKNQINQFILTAAQKSDALELLNHFEIINYFKAVEGLDNRHAASKVERGIHLIKDNQIDAASAVMVGDTMHDYHVAEAIGVDCILISNGHQSKERLQTVAENIIVLEDVGELIPHLIAL